MRELGEQRAFGFLKKFYGWYLGRGRFPRPFKQELVMLPTLDEVESACSPPRRAPATCWSGSRPSCPTRQDEVLLDSLPISIYGGG